MCLFFQFSRKYSNCRNLVLASKCACTLRKVGVYWNLFAFFCERTVCTQSGVPLYFQAVPFQSSCWERRLVLVSELNVEIPEAFKFHPEDSVAHDTWLILMVWQSEWLSSNPINWDIQHSFSSLLPSNDTCAFRTVSQFTCFLISRFRILWKTFSQPAMFKYNYNRGVSLNGRSIHQDHSLSPLLRYYHHHVPKSYENNNNNSVMFDYHPVDGQSTDTENSVNSTTANSTGCYETESPLMGRLSRSWSAVGRQPNSAPAVANSRKFLAKRWGSKECNANVIVGVFYVVCCAVLCVSDLYKYAGMTTFAACFFTL